MDFESSQIQLMALAIKHAMEYEKDMMSRYYEYKKRVSLGEVRDIIIELERDSYKRMKKLDDTVKKLNLEQLHQNIDTLDDVEALKELTRYQNTGHNMYNEYILRVKNPYLREVFKELREGMFGYIDMLESEIIKLKTLPSVSHEIYPVK